MSEPSCPRCGEELQRYQTPPLRYYCPREGKVVAPEEVGVPQPRLVTCPTCHGHGKIEIMSKPKRPENTPEPVRKIPEGLSGNSSEALNGQPEEIKRTDNVTIKRTRGRPKKWASDAERKRAAREGHA